MKTKPIILTTLAILTLIMFLGCGDDDKHNPLAPLRDAVQIILTANDLAIATTGEPVAYLQENKVIIPQGGESQKWDYRKTPISATDVDAWSPVPANPAFANATATFPVTYGLLGFAVPAVEYVQRNADDYQHLGFTVSSLRIHLDLAKTSFIDVPDQVVPYAPLRRALHFPMAFGNPADVFESSSRMITGKLTYGLLGFDQTPVGYQVTHDRTNTVIGWGVVALPNYAEPFDVLLVKADNKITEEIFVDGVMATQEFLTPFGLIQDRIIEYTRYQFYAKGNPEPVLTVEVQDGLVTFALYLREAVNG